MIEIKPIGEIQGSVGPADAGLLHRSPFAPPTGNGAGQAVVIQGVIYQKTLSRTNTGANQYGFFIQNTAAQADGDPFTSDGIWIFMGAFPDVLNAVMGQPAYIPQVGDEIVLRGNAAEFFNFTQLSSPRFVRSVGTALDIDALLPPVDVDPEAELDDANRSWERLEGMRLRVPGGSLVTDGLDVFPATADAEMWVVRGDSEIAGRSGYAQRVFRDAHPLDDEPGLVDNGNGFRILVGALGLKQLGGDNTILLPPSRTFDTVSNALVGGLNFSFNKYRIETAVAPALVHGIEPALNAPPTSGNRLVEHSVGDYNVENLYDFRDDPNDGCDFVGGANTGCPGVSPPFDYVPASNAVYQERLGLIAEQIVGDLHAPDILLVQEAEDQDICAVSGGSLVCGTADDADGKPDTLQELALRIQAQSGIGYDAAYDRDGSDDRGIVAALMYRTDRVQLLPATADNPVLGSTPDFTYRSGANAYNSDVQNPKSLNAPLPADVTGPRDGNEVYTRDPQVGAVPRLALRRRRRRLGGRLRHLQPLLEHARQPREPAPRAGGVPGADRAGNRVEPRRRRRRLQRLPAAGRSARSAERPARPALQRRAAQPLGHDGGREPGGRVLVRVRGPGADARRPVRHTDAAGRAGADAGRARERRLSGRVRR